MYKTLTENDTVPVLKIPLPSLAYIDKLSPSTVALEINTWAPVPWYHPTTPIGLYSVFVIVLVASAAAVLLNTISKFTLSSTVKVPKSSVV